MEGVVSVSPGDVVRSGIDRFVVVRTGVPIVALRACQPGAEHTDDQHEIPAAEVEDAFPLRVLLDDTARLRGVPEHSTRLTRAGFSRMMRARIARDVRTFVDTEHAAAPFVAGESTVPYAGRVFDSREVVSLVDSSLDFWLTLGKKGDAFQRALSLVLGTRNSVLVNSGSSANLVAFASLTSPKLGDRAIRSGDEVITAAAGFPTTVNPILQHGAVPVFVDCDPATGNLDPAKLEEALSPRTRAVMIAHALGNPFDLDVVADFCRRHGLWLVEDNCDALGSLWKGKPTGSFGDLSTQSFYPPHHLTMGEGGAVNVVRDARLKSIVESFRDWGRDCWCEPGASDTCGKRFAWKLGDLPEGYDHKYVYSHVGYNLKPLELQAAIGLEQIKKLPAFTAARRRNWQMLRDGAKDLEEFFVLPSASPHAEPSWFGFLLVLRPEAPFGRDPIVRFLESKRIQTRMLFGGNLVRQPAYRDLPKRTDGLPPFRVSGSLAGSDRLTEQAFFLGVYPGLSAEQIGWMLQSLHDAVRHAKETKR